MPPFTSARVQSRFEFVKLGGDMYTHYHVEILPVTEITDWYHLVPRTILEHSRYVSEYRVYTGTRSSPVEYV